MDELTKHLMSVAMFSLKYQEALNLDEKKISNTLGIIFRRNQNQIKNFTAQELALVTVFLSNINEQYFSDYLKLFNKNVIEYAIKNAKSIEEQVSFLNSVEYFSLTFYKDFSSISNIIDIVKNFDISLFIKTHFFIKLLGMM